MEPMINPLRDPDNQRILLILIGLNIVFAVVVVILSEQTLSSTGIVENIGQWAGKHLPVL